MRSAKARALEAQLRAYDREMARADANALGALANIVFAAAQLALDNARRLDDLDAAARRALRGVR